MILGHEVHGGDNAPTLLLGGSLGTNLRMWDPQLDLADRFRLVLHDHRGHGASPVPLPPYEIADMGRDVLDLMDFLGIERARHCGASIGGMVALWLAINAPERVEAIVLICSSSYLPPAAGWRHRAEAVLKAGSTEPVADAVVDRWLTPAFAESHEPIRASLRAMLVSTDPVGYAACCGAIERMDLRQRLAEISVPALIMSGSQDSATPIEHQRAIANSIPGGRHIVIEPAAHLASIERPADVNHLLSEELK